MGLQSQARNLRPRARITVATELEKNHRRSIFVALSWFSVTVTTRVPVKRILTQTGKSNASVAKIAIESGLKRFLAFEVLNEISHREAITLISKFPQSC